MFRMQYAVWFTCLFCMAVAFGAENVPGDSPIRLSLKPERIDIGTFYRGAKIQVSAQVPACDGAVIVLATGGEEVSLDRKGRVAGIWLNVAKVTAGGVPQTYILAASDSLKNICSPEVQQQLELGPEYLRKTMKFTCDKPLTGSEFDELLKLKMRSGAYNTGIKINLAPISMNRRDLSAVLPIPATLPPGHYKVRLYCFKDGRPVQQAFAELTIRRVGLADLMASFARERAAVYGATAIVVAMLVGIGMGVIFNSLPRTGH